MNFEINIKEKNFINKLDNSKLNVLKNIDIKINSNEFVCIVGPSGCGKTTLMNIIGGLIYADKQNIKLNGKTKKDIEENISYVFQSSRLLPWLTVRENIELVSQKKTNIENDINGLLNNFGLSEFIDFYPKAISGGMRRKVSLARALINKPSILLMDEPFVSLDQPTSEGLYDVLINYWKMKPITIILITHSLKEALLLSDRILFFSKKPGTVVFDYKVKSNGNPLNIDNKNVTIEGNNLKKKYNKILDGIV
jgi:ABC-type nitrate/sulfonate/bicarbonate transport system, ATPase component